MWLGTGASAGGKRDVAQEGAGENEGEEQVAAGRDEAIRRKQGIARSRRYRREANGPSLRIVD